MSARIDINTDILVWAIHRAGFDESEFSVKFPHVLDWIERKKLPTQNQLETFARKVHLPFGYLFLSEPPEEHLPIPFFRTENGEKQNVSINVYDTILLLQNRQEWLTNYLKDNDYPSLDFVNKFKNKSSVEQIVRDIKKTLGLEDTWAESLNTWEDAIGYLTEKIEDVGVIVTFNGIVGNNTRRKIPVEECRGFVLVDNFAPFMFINAADSKAAQIFTLIHELAHIWTGQSAGFDYRHLSPADNDNERICDMVAAEFLVPQDRFIPLWKEYQDIKKLTRVFKVSPVVIARRAWDLGIIKRDDFFEFYNRYMAQFHTFKSRQSGGNFYATAKKRLSPTFVAYVNRAVKQNHLLFRDACKLTGLKANTYVNFVNNYLQKPLFTKCTG